MLRPLLCPAPSPSAHSSLQTIRYSAHLRSKWYPPPPALASNATDARPPLPLPADDSSPTHHAFGGTPSTMYPSLPCPSQPDSDDDVPPPLISDSSSDSDSVSNNDTSRCRTTITGASSCLPPPHPNTLAAPALSSSPAPTLPPQWNPRPTASAVTSPLPGSQLPPTPLCIVTGITPRHLAGLHTSNCPCSLRSTPLASPLHPPSLCLATANIAHLPPPRQLLPGRHITNCPSSPRFPPASRPLGRNARFASQLQHPLSPPAAVHPHQRTRALQGIAPSVGPPLHHSESHALARHRSGRPPVPASLTMARCPPHYARLSIHARTRTIPRSPSPRPSHHDPSPLSHTISTERSADNSLVARRRQRSRSPTRHRSHEPPPPSRVSRHVRSISSTPTRIRGRPQHTSYSPLSPLRTDLPALIMLQERLLRRQRQRQR